MGRQIRCAAQAEVGEPVTVVDAETAYSLWAATYDSGANPVLALEQRVLQERLDITPCMRVLDLATGTGRWLESALAQGADAFGVDPSQDMLAQAAGKGFSRRLVRATLAALPFPDGFADLSICSFALSYLSSPETAIGEMARTTRRIVISDLHPEAVRAGWSRSFRANGGKYEIASWTHELVKPPGFDHAWIVEAGFGEPERAIFESAGKGAAFDKMRQIPAVLISCWRRA
jgi:malonyl-CoA O-methyltransferase